MGGDYPEYEFDDDEFDDDDDFPEIPEIEIIDRNPVILNTNPWPLPEKGVGRCVVYLFKLTKFNVFKVGITSVAKGDQRPLEVINQLGHDAEILRIIQVENEKTALEIEKATLQHGTNLPVDLKTRKLSGRYEFFEVGPSRVSGILDFLDANRAF